MYLQAVLNHRHICTIDIFVANTISVIQCAPNSCLLYCCCFLLLTCYNYGVCILVSLALYIFQYWQKMDLYAVRHSYSYVLLENLCMFSHS